MTTDKTRHYNHQMMHIFTLLIAQGMLSTIGIALSLFHLNNNIFLFVGILTLNIVGLILFQPFQIMKYLRERVEFKRGLEAITTPKAR